MSVAWHHEADLRKHKITADVVHESGGRLLVSLSEDDLDHLLDYYMPPDDLDERLNEVESAAHEIGLATGEETGYENALADLKDEHGAIWDLVKPMLERAFEEGHQAACEEIEELA